MALSADLSPQRIRFEKLLVDTATVTHDPTGEDNATLDRTTGKLTGAASDAVVGDPIPVLLRPAGDAFRVDAATPLAINRVEFLFRAADPTPEIGDLVTITASLNNPDFVGREFAVLAVNTTSLNFAQVIVAEEVLSAPRRA